MAWNEGGWGLRFASRQAPGSSPLFLVAHPLSRLRVTFFACPKKATKERAPEARAPSGFPPTALSLRGPSTGLLPDDGLAGLPAGHPDPCGARAIPRSGGRGRRGLRGRTRRFVPEGRWSLPPVRSRTQCFKELGTCGEGERSHPLVPSSSYLATRVPPLNAPWPGAVSGNRPKGGRQGCRPAERGPGRPFARPPETVPGLGNPEGARSSAAFLCFVSLCKQRNEVEPAQAGSKPENRCEEPGVWYEVKQSLHHPGPKPQVPGSFPAP